MAAATNTQLISDDKGPVVRQLCIAMMVIPTIAVIIRTWSRAISKSPKNSRFWWDDWLCIAIMPLTFAQLAVTVHWTTIGLGKHLTEVPPGDVTSGLKILFAGYFFYDISISLPKLSALLFYARIFNIENNRRYRYALWATAGLVVAWLLFAIPSTIWQCVPIEKAWEPLKPGRCLNTYQWWLGSAISSVIIDFIILLLPLPMLWNLQLKTGKKVLIMGVFVSGYCVIVASIGRLIAVSKVGDGLVTDMTYNVVPIICWLSVEAPISVVSICLPSIFVFVKRAVATGPRSLFSPGTINGTKAGNTHNSLHTHTSAHRSWIGTPTDRARGPAGRGGFFGRFGTKGFRGSMEPLYDAPHNQEYKAAAVYKSPSSMSSQGSHPDAGRPIPMKSVWVQRDISISRSQR